MKIKDNLIIGWKVAALSPKIASIRYRALLPLLACEKNGAQCRLYSYSQFVNLDEIDALVVVKSFSVDDLMLVQQAFIKDKPVIIDLCDNIFISAYGRLPANEKSLPSAIFKEMAQMAQVIVVTTDALAKVVRDEIDSSVVVKVIPDGIEDEDQHAKIVNRLNIVSEQEKLNFVYKIKKKLTTVFYRINEVRSVKKITLVKLIIKSLYRKIKKGVKFGVRKTKQCIKFVIRRIVDSPVALIDKKDKPQELNNADVSQLNTKYILWFGNHGAAHANFGMLDLLIIQKDLEAIAKNHTVELVVVSNDKEKYNKHILPFSIPSRYVEWRAGVVEQYLKCADVVVIPNSLDAFSICKSSNRAVLSLSHGVPVVATSTLEMIKMQSCIMLDDFEKGLEFYLSNSDLAEQHVKKAKELIGLMYGANIIADKWLSILNEVIDKHSFNNSVQKPEMIVAIHLPQDLDLALPILKAAEARNIQCTVWTSVTAVNKWAQILDAMHKYNYAYRILPEQINVFDALLFPASARVLLSVSESNLNPHRFTYQLTKLANRAGLRTATIQHGFENIGLTYSDNIHCIKNIKFASHKIYTWGNHKTYHPDMSAQTEKKCFPIGCSKPKIVKQASIMNTVPNQNPVIGIFENLHWHRYSEEYRDFFIECISRIAKEFSNVTFIIKPHNAGMWLTSRYQKSAPVAENLLIIDPRNEDWKSVTAPQMLGRLSAVITTPSTVAIDALRQNLPVAMVKHKLSLSNYDPLFMLASFDDWSTFVKQVLDDQLKTQLEIKGQLFLENIILPGDAAKLIVEDLFTGADISVAAHV